MRSTGPTGGSGRTRATSDAGQPRVVGPMRTALNRRLAVVVLDTFPIRNRSQDVPVANRLRDAIRHIEAHAQDRPSVPEIAAACGLSQRGLQDVFARTLGTTPNRFMRDHRLDCVRRELLVDRLIAASRSPAPSRLLP